ncbi:NAD(P)H-binding protein [Nonomuraea sp. NPDC050790]|uniref:NAD(P)H-binding protein n=1 Tax=Nonomuraea sp. NPDC050790 TaxID=3364371 RepID=UPI0037901204
MTSAQSRMPDPVPFLPELAAIAVPLHQIIANGVIPPVTIGLLQLRAGQILGSTYFTIRETANLRRLEETEERITAVATWHDATVFTSAERIALELVEAVLTPNPSGERVSDDLYARAAAHYDHRALWHLVMAIAHIGFFTPAALIAKPIPGRPPGKNYSPAAAKVAVAGATGRLGRHVVDVLTERGHQVVPMSRATGVDLVTGEGLAEALTGVDIVIDVASWHSSEQEAATEFFRASARNLHEYGQKAGVAQITVASIIGVESATAGFLAAKKEHEALLLSGPLPVRILRAAQFHEFVGQLLDWRQGEVAYVPALPTQLVAGRTVAEELVGVALDPRAPAAGAPIPEIAGPRAQTMAEAAALLGARRGVEVVAVDGAGMPDAELAAKGAFLPGPHAKLAGPAFQEWLDAQP